MRSDHSSSKRRPRHDDESATGPRSAGPAKKRIGPKALRIIGGQLRRRNVLYTGDRATRPMKDSVRENLFNILGAAVDGTVAWDLFAGTGILAMEAVSRGAVHAIAIDSSRESVRSIRQSAESLGIAHQVESLLGDTFRLAPSRLKHAAGQRRVVFCCPPYALWDSQLDRLHALLFEAMAHAAPGSLIVAETDRRFDAAKLPSARWDLRVYGNTQLAIAELGDVSPSE